MVKLRLKRIGKKKKPFYRIVAADSRAARDGRFIEMVGTYDPIAKPHVVECKEDRIFHWLSNGAQPTDTVKGLLRGKGLWLKWTLTKQGADEAKIASEMEAWESEQVEKAKRAENKAAKADSEKVKKKAAEEEETKKVEAAASAPEEVVEEATDEVKAETTAPKEETAEEVKADATAPVEEVDEEAKTEKTAKKENSEDETK